MPVLLADSLPCWLSGSKGPLGKAFMTRSGGQQTPRSEVLPTAGSHVSLEAAPSPVEPQLRLSSSRHLQGSRGSPRHRGPATPGPQTLGDHSRDHRSFYTTVFVLRLLPQCSNSYHSCRFLFCGCCVFWDQEFQDCARSPGLTGFSKMSCSSSLGVSPAVGFSEMSGESCVVPM